MEVEMKKKLLVGLVTALSVVGAVNTSLAAIVPLEWSDIKYTQGRYSRIYFDYIQGGDTQPGKFYVINDWMVNQADGGTNGGLKPNEYNLFTFNLGKNNYNIQIFPDGKSNLLVTGTDPNGVLNLTSATSWTTSPNEPNVEHTIWEFAFDVQPTTITQFVGCDPAGPTTIYEYPTRPPGLTGPSQYQHIIDGAFSDLPLVSTLPPNPTRIYWDPVADPKIPKLKIELLQSGGLIAIPEPASMLLLGTGLAAFAGVRKLKKQHAA
jgi:hypothetical protein